MRASITVKQRRRSAGNWAAWAPAAMRFTRVALVIYASTALDRSRTPSTPRYFSPRISSRWSSSPTDWDLEHVLSAIRASVLEAPANTGMGTSHREMHASAHVWEIRPRLPPSPFDALLNRQRLYTVVSLRPPLHTLYIALPYRQGPSSSEHSTPPVHQRHPPYPSRPHQWTIRAPDDRRTRRVPSVLSPRYVVSFSPVPPSGSLTLNLPALTVSTAPSPPSVSPPCYLHPHADFSACRVSTYALRLQQPLSPIQQRFSRSTFGEPSGIRLRRPQVIIRLRSGPNARKIPTLRTTSWSRPQRPPRHPHIHGRVLVHAPSRAITILRPKPSPHAGPVPFLRASGSSAIASSTPPHVTHDPRLPNGDSTPLRSILRLRHVFPCCRHSAQ
ncbi:hypothetical protein DFH08DRAFT_904981 [Mycena albidolilacea]|uniref:Uncharacterized protein n=1 Tax=Mycena albidolilacea TaxID=1033008 RepID=A0AAD7E983_9AGAR|nr:hypothetical protein DFH08DRAFT_904981 [Mycena albidolilacea]